MKNDLRPCVLVFTDWYEPGMKAGGPIRSAVNFVNNLSSDLRILVFTSDRDLGDKKPYSEIITNQWNDVNAVKIFYASPEYLNWNNISKLIHSVSPKYVYLNNMFSTYFSIYPLLLKKLGNIQVKIILAPRGMLRSSALAHKSFKKTVYLKIFFMLGLHRSVIFHATDSMEVNDIKRIFKEESAIKMIDNLPGVPPPSIPPPFKNPRLLNMIFVGRIHPIKNLDFVLNCLMAIKDDITLTIIAAIEDKIYWEECEKLMLKLPGNIKIKILQNIQNKELIAIIQQNHVFILPTKGENFGHAIFEALSAGRPVIISDQTPWRNLQQEKAGFDIPLSDGQAFRNAIQLFVDMEQDEYVNWCTNASRYSMNKLNVKTVKRSYLELFQNYDIVESIV